MNERYRRRLGAVYSVGALLTLFFCSQVSAEQYRFDRPDYLGDAGLLPNWAATLARHADQKLQIESCLEDENSCEDRRLKSLRHILLRAVDLEPDRQFLLINRYVNNRHYRRDRPRSSRRQQRFLPGRL